MLQTKIAEIKRPPIMADLAEPDGFYIIIAIENDQPRILTDFDGFTLKYTSLNDAKSVLVALQNSGSLLNYFARKITF